MFYLLTPDGFTIDHKQKLYKDIRDALTDFQEWKRSYQNQGYYSSSIHGRIPLHKLWGHMILHSKPFYDVWKDI